MSITSSLLEIWKKNTEKYKEENMTIYNPLPRKNIFKKSKL